MCFQFDANVTYIVLNDFTIYLLYVPSQPQALSLRL